jgi:2-oxoglutarate dehydrogenase E1 component
MSTSFATPFNTDLIDEYYQRWLDNPASVDAAWRGFFEGFTLAANGDTAALLTGKGAGDTAAADRRQSRVDSLIYHYRSIGHIQAHLDPLSPPPAPSPRLALSEFGLCDDDLEGVYNVGHYLTGGSMKLRDIISNLDRTYCGHVGVEYLHIQDTEVRRWLQSRMEPVFNQPTFERAQRLRILRRLHQAETFERFLHTRFLGQKRFSLEGAETLIPLLDTLVEFSPALGIRELVMGMAHRGRLTVLANIFRKSYEFMFEEFSENYIPNTVAGDGDVKYHLGYDTEVATSSGATVGLRMAANPSHLEAVDPVVEGKARARQRILGDIPHRKKVVPVIIHGDAAFAGQGIVAETLNFSQLPGYRTGGTIHIVVNNQIGFTTNPSESRSSRYCTDIAKMIEAPIFHVNGDHPEHVCMVAELALEFRQQFGRDIVIDMYCYRRHGHNEADEPAFTQPVLYRRIAEHPPISEQHSRELVAAGVLTQPEAEALKNEYLAELEESLAKVKKSAQDKADARAKLAGSTGRHQPPYSFAPAPTAISRELLEASVKGLTTLPDTFRPNPKIKRLIETRAKALTENQPIDWSYGESLAFASLLLEQTPVRLSGQDVERGTFSQRHCVLNDVENNEKYSPLKHLGASQAQFCVYNSSLSEAAVLGFDYGYSLDFPSMLCIWEAQFGDFANGAQSIIDQFIVSGESKWQRHSGIVMLLPHGYEGQGPEHSSARLERFLQLCAENNIQVCNPTTPSQIFHVLRRQMRRDFKKPLVVMSPKSLLRNPAAVSPLADLTTGHFQEIIDDSGAAGNCERLILCSGKVYYDLVDHRQKLKDTATAIVRVEQLYPLHTERLTQLAAKYSKAKLVWCQDESQNMGAWSFIAPQLEAIFERKPQYAGRDASASPAVGALALHKMEQAALLQQAFSV